MTAATHRTIEDVLPALADSERLAAMEDTGLLSGGDETLDRVARLATALVDAPRAFVTMVTPEAHHLPGMVRRDDPANQTRTEALNASLCQFTVATGEPLVIPDSHQDPLVRNMGSVRSGQIRAYAGIPLRASGGPVLGTLCVVDLQPRRWDEDELALLHELSALAAREIEGRITSTREGRVRELSQQVVQQVPLLADAVDSLFELAERSDDARLQRYASLAHTRMASLGATADRLQQATPEPPSTQPRPSRADLRNVVTRAVQGARAATRSDLISLERGTQPLPVECDSIPIERAVTHLLVTALHHSEGSAPVVARLEATTPGTASSGHDRSSPATATLTVSAADCRVPAGELARLVSRFQEASCDTVTADDTSASASLRIAGGSVTAQTDRVRGGSSREGLVLTARWPLTAT